MTQTPNRRRRANPMSRQTQRAQSIAPAPEPMHRRMREASLRVTANILGYDSDGEEISDYDWKDRYEEFLNDAFGTVDVCGMTFDSGSALRQLDEIAFDMSALDYWDSELSDGNVFDSYEDYQEANGLTDEDEDF